MPGTVLTWETVGNETHRSQLSDTNHSGWGWGGAGERQDISKQENLERDKCYKENKTRMD